MSENIFDSYETPLPEVDHELKCRHLGQILTKSIPAPKMDNAPDHSHMGQECDDCKEVLHIFQSFCRYCGPLP